MSSKMKQWVALTAVGVLAVLAAGWFLLVSPKRSEAAQVRADVASQESTNSGLETQLAMLKAQAKTLPQQQARLAMVAAKIPDNPALPALIRALSNAAADSDVELVSMSPSTPSPVVPPAGAAAGQTLPSTTGTAAKPASGTATAPRTLSGATTSPAAAAATAGQLNSIALSINVVGGYFQIEQFFDRLENLTRAAKVVGFTLAPGANPMKATPQGATAAVAADPGRVLSATVNANVYMAAGRQVVPNPAAPAK